MDADDQRQKQREQGNLEEAARLWRAWRTINEMVQDRGYELADAEVKISFEDFKNKYQDTDGSGSIKYAPAILTPLVIY